MSERFNWRIDPLEEIRKFYCKSHKAHSYIEFTVASKQTASWIMKGSYEQIHYYERYIDKCLSDYGKYLRQYNDENVIKYTVVYETHRNGNIHAHGIVMVPKFKCYNHAYDFHVTDLAKYLCSKSKGLYDPKKYNSTYNRYWSPFCTVQMSDPNDTVTINGYTYDSRLDYWLQYMCKYQSVIKEDPAQATALAVKTSGSKPALRREKPPLGERGGWGECE